VEEIPVYAVGSLGAYWTIDRLAATWECDVIRSRVSSLLLAVVMTMVMADGAHGHILSGEVAGFASGFAHLISGLDHIIAILLSVFGARNLVRRRSGCFRLRFLC
jgi:hydrogenase/urease accessory protein HupE